MTETPVVTKEEWVLARKALYKREGELIEFRDEIASKRQQLPRFRIGQDDYTFDAPEGRKRLLDLFDGRRQLIVYHFMVPPETGEFCRSCSFWIDNVGHLAHFWARDTTFVVDCPVPLEKFVAFKERMEWDVPVVSSHGTDFYADFFVTLDDGVHIQPGISVFLREGDEVYHTYSTLVTGSELLNGTYNYLDLTPLGRQEDGLSFKHEWVRYHDQYES